ncbi:hypothetical protein N665_0164s0034 [Sinapis alba]|nr:hypothetical protein N665_0164s0034 [Sinapis alba]
MKAIINAVCDGDLEGLRTALETFPHGLNKSFELGRLLFSAIDNFTLPCFLLLLENGAALDMENVDGDTLLHQLSDDQDTMMAYLDALITRGVEPYLEIPDPHGMSPFHAACLKGNFMVAQRLQQVGANVRNRSNEMNTPLHDACHSAETMELILNNGGDADLEAENTSGERPLHYASCNNSLRCVQLLVERGAQVDVLTEAGNTPLLIAIETRGNVDIVDYLLDHGANPNGQADVDGSTPLHLACKIIYGSTPFVQVLISSGAFVNAVDNVGRTPLYLACKFGEVDCINTLLTSGADPILDDDSGNTLLHSAVSSTLTDVETQRVIVARLIGVGCNPKIRNSSGERPESVAVHPEIYRLLHAYSG